MGNGCSWCYDNSTLTGSCQSYGGNCTNYLSSGNSTGCPAAGSCQGLGCTACAGNAGCSFCGMDASVYSSYGVCVQGANKCLQNDTIVSAGCAAFTAGSTSICESLGCQQCNDNVFGLSCQWCGTPTGGLCTSQFYCPNGLQSSFNITCPAPAACEAITDCTACNANPACSFCGAPGYSYCVTGANKCVHNDTVSSSQCAAFAAASKTICDAYDCAQCLNNEFCNWCGSPSGGHCTAKFCTASQPTLTNASLCAAPGTCDSLSCSACAANSACSACGVASDANTFGYFSCVTGANNCPLNQTVTSGQCAAVTASLTTICEQLSCHQCFADQGQGCAWCGSSCVTGGCPVGQTAATNASVCGATTNSCEKLSCSTCGATTGCSFCGSSDFGYGFCVSGTCQHNDTVATSACASFTSSITSVCEVLSCRQCLQDFSCSNCGGTCQTLACNDNTNPTFDASTCPAAGPCESLGCAACVANPSCSFCGTSGIGSTGYGFCVSGANKCTHNDSITTVAGCAALPFDPCPLLGCAACAASVQCSWCGSPTGGSCTSGFCADSTQPSLTNASLCALPAAGSCEAITDCTACSKNTACQYCVDHTFNVGFCVTGQKGICGNGTVATCASAPTAPTIAGQTPMPPVPPGPPGKTTTVAPGNGGTTKAGSPPAGTTAAAGPGGATTQVKHSAAAKFAFAAIAAFVALLALL